MSGDASMRAQQLKTMASVLQKLRTGLDAAGHVDKLLVYTTRFNGFYDDSSRPAGFKPYDSDGEGLVIANELKSLGTTLSKTVDVVNIMMYDVPPADLAAAGGFTAATYQTIFKTFEPHMFKNQIVMGFEPGGQAAGGKWEGMTMDMTEIDYIQAQGYGGAMFWAINQTPHESPIPTGENAQALALYATEVFS